MLNPFIQWQHFHVFVSRESCGSVHIFEGLRFVLVQPITFNTDSVALKIYFYNRDVSESIVDSG